jgi:hypothetical protein
MSACGRILLVLTYVAALLAPLRAGQGQRVPATRNAIVGRVTDPSGAPAAGVLVTLVVREQRDGVVRFHPASARARFFTDENGRYRIDQATPGEYFVVAIPRNKALGLDGTPNRSGVRNTYHPSALAAADAKPVMVNIREPQIADITLQPARLAVISGTVFTSAGAPANGGRLRFSLGDGLFGIGGDAIALTPNGRFAVAGVAPGTYFLHYSEGPWPPPPTEDAPLISGATVTIREGDATNIRVMPIRMVQGTGHVVIDPTQRGQFDPARFTVSASPLNWDGNPGPQRPGRLRDDLTFEFKTWPGQGIVRVLPEGGAWVIKSVRYRGADVTRTGIDFQPGEAISGIEIELARLR